MYRFTIIGYKLPPKHDAAERLVEYYKLSKEFNTEQMKHLIL